MNPTRCGMRLRAALLLSLAAPGAGCTVVKPVVSALAFPVMTIRDAIQDKDSEDEKEGEEKYQRTPAILAVPTVLVVAPVAFVTLFVAGAVGGLTSGIASDFNILLGHASLADTGESLKYPFRTNAPRPKD